MMLPVCFFRRLFARPVCVLTLSVAAFASVAVTATPASTATRFSDVRSEGWEVDAIEWFDTQRITQGCHADRFCPDEEMSREQQLTFLWRYEGSPAPGDGMPFTDVPNGRFFTDPITWAYNTGVTEGIGNNRFGTGRDVTRAEAVTFLWRYVGETEPTYPLFFTTDVTESTFYTDAVRWASETGVTKGCDLQGRRFCPDRPVTRAEFATFLHRLDQYLNNPNAEPTQLTTPNPEPEPEPEPEPVYYHEFVANHQLVTPPEGYLPWLQYEWFDGSLSLRNAHVEGCTGEITGHLTWVHVYKVDDGCTTSTGTAEWRFYKVGNKYEDYIWLPVTLSDARNAWDR